MQNVFIFFGVITRMVLARPNSHMNMNSTHKHMGAIVKITEKHDSVLPKKSVWIEMYSHLSYDGSKVSE
jgi:hypothetical protein